MKFNRLFCFVQIEDGNFHQILLDEDQMLYVGDLIRQLHDGKIKCLETKLDGLYIKEKENG